MTRLLLLPHACMSAGECRGEYQWCDYRVVHPLDVELPRSLSIVVTSWNLPMHIFLKNCGLVSGTGQVASHVTYCFLLIPMHRCLQANSQVAGEVHGNFVHILGQCYASCECGYGAGHTTT